MLSHPWSMVTKVATSRWWAFFVPLSRLSLTRGRQSREVVTGAEGRRSR